MSERKIVFVGGEYGEKAIPSAYAAKLAQELKRVLPGSWEIHNGGTREELEKIHAESIASANVIFWLPEGEAARDKDRVRQIKNINQKTMLVTLQDNPDRKLSRPLLVARALDQKANLTLERTQAESGGQQTTIIDPLNNVFAENETDVATLATRLAARLEQLIAVKRVRSEKIGDALPCPVDEDVTRFLGLVREHANTFHDLIHIPNQGRSLGNISFRCERGFPAARTCDPNIAFISKRNVDKRFIGPEDLVAVRLDSGDPVRYYADGDKKPSVDGPIQIGLFNAYPNINYILHSHVYIEGAPFTDNIFPCGASEELEEIRTKFPDNGNKQIFVNLRGHGALAMVSDWRDLERIPYVSREKADREMPWQPPAPAHECEVQSARAAGQNAALS